MTKLISGNPETDHAPEEPIDYDGIVRATLGNGDGSPSSAPVGRHVARPMSPNESQRFRDRPSWHARAASEEGAARWEAVEDAVDAVDASTAAVRSLDAEQQREQQRYAAQVAAALEAGEEAPAPVFTAWPAEQIRRQAVAAACAQRLRTARRDYDDLVQAELPEWRSRLASEVARLHGEASRALTAAEGPLSAYLSAASTLDSMTPAREPDPAEFIEEARGLMGPGVADGYVRLKAADLAREAKAAQDEHRRRFGRAQHGLDLVREALA